MRKTRSSVIDKNETNSDRFIRLVNNRMNKSISFIESIGAMNGKTYEYDDNQIKIIEDCFTKAISDMVSDLKSRAKKVKKFTFLS